MHVELFSESAQIATSQTLHNFLLKKNCRKFSVQKIFLLGLGLGIKILEFIFGTDPYEIFAIFLISYFDLILSAKQTNMNTQTEK